MEEIKTKKFDGNICRRLPDKTLLEDLREGDYVVYWENGRRVGKVKKNHKGYKYRWVRIYPHIWNGYVLSRSKKIKLKYIREGWRKQDEFEKE